MSGTVLATVEVPVERGKLRELAAAFDDPDPAWITGEQPLAPPTFVLSAVAWPRHPVPDAPIVTLGPITLHAEQELEFHSEVRAGDVLQGTERLHAVRDLDDGSRLVTFESKFVTSKGLVAIISRTTVWDVTNRRDQR
jgi:hypothetical protein